MWSFHLLAQGAALRRRSARAYPTASRIRFGVASAMLPAVVLIGIVAAGSSAAEDWGQEYAQRIHAAQAVSPLGDSLFGDNVSLYNGTVTFTATDISLPGNNALPVALSRIMDNQGFSAFRSFGSWDIDLPYLSGVFAAAGVYQNGSAPGYWEPANRCTTVGPPPPYQINWAVSFFAGDYWSGNRLHVPEGGGELLAKTTDPKLVMPSRTGLSDWITKDRWTFGCSPNLQSDQPGEGFIAYAPDGRKITFDWMVNADYSPIARNVDFGVGARAKLTS